MLKKQQMMASNQKMQENKPTIKVQFYIGIHVTKVEKNIFLKSTYPKVHSISIIAFLSAQQLHFVQVQLNSFLSVHLE